MKTLLDLFKTFQNQKDKTAFVYRTGIRRFIFSYGDLYQLSLKTASWLESRGINKGDRVIIWAPNSPWWVIAFWGVILRGGIVVPVDFSSGKERTEKIAELAEVKLIIQSQYKLEKIEKPNCIFIEDIQYLIADYSLNSPSLTLGENDIAELIYTSGTTGDPKGVQLTHKNLITNLLQVNEHISVITKDYNFLSLLPLSHMFEQMGGLFTPLYKGGSIIYIRTLKPSAIMQALAEENIFTIMIVPRLLQALKNSIQRELQRKKFLTLFAKLVKFGVHRKFGKNFKFFISGGSALDIEIAKFWQNLGFVVIEGYGLTECSPILAGNFYEQQKLGSVGKSLPGVTLKIEEGEILSKGENIFSGYWQNKIATHEAFNLDGWFKTGDLGEIDKDGWIYIRGRKKDLIVTSAGINVYPEDIENVLNKIHGVKESCVISRQGQEGEEVHAVLILENNVIKSADIIEEANGQLDSLQQINSFSIWPELEFPKTTTLKIQKYIVKEIIQKDHFKNISNQSNDKLINFIAKVTGKIDSEIEENSILATDLGLSSVARLELVNYLEQEFKIDMDDTLINQNTTVKSLREIIQNKEKSKNKSKLRFWSNTKFIRVVRMVCDLLINYPIFCFSVNLKTKGLYHLDNIKTPVIFIANHISYYDQPAVMFSLPAKWRYNTATAVWEEFFFKDINPIKKAWKRFAYYYGFVGLNIFPLPQSRGFRNSLEFMGKLVDNKINILIFPEGERSYDGKILPFMGGLGLMVKELQIPVVPIKIEGMEKVFPRGAILPKRGEVTVTFGKSQHFKQESPSEILEISKNLITNL